MTLDTHTPSTSSRLHEICSTTARSPLNGTHFTLIVLRRCSFYFAHITMTKEKYCSFTSKWNAINALRARSMHVWCVSSSQHLSCNWSSTLRTEGVFAWRNLIRLWNITICKFTVTYAKKYYGKNRGDVAKRNHPKTLSQTELYFIQIGEVTRDCFIQSIYQFLYEAHANYQFNRYTCSTAVVPIA